MIYCSGIEEAKQVAKEAMKHIYERSQLKPAFTVKRGCTEFTNAHREYGEIGDIENLRQGPKQRKDWKIKEQRFIHKYDKIIESDPTGWEFNLGELLIIKNWIAYALSINEATAITKYGKKTNENKAISDLVRLREAEN